MKVHEELLQLLKRKHTTSFEKKVGICLSLSLCNYKTLSRNPEAIATWPECARNEYGHMLLAYPIGGRKEYFTKCNKGVRVQWLTGVVVCCGT
jgi:predicted metalloenzyme YecM